MPRKQNGFGNSKSFAFKGAGRVDKGKGVGSFGFYPRERRYGTSIHRTVIENWNLNSGWTKWRRGYELYSKAAFSILKVLNQDYDPGLPEDEDDNPKYIPSELTSLLYQGTPYEIKTVFSAIEMPTLKADNNTHYVARRSVDEDSDLGIITGRYTGNEVEQRKYNELWFKGEATTPRARLVLQMVNERLTDGETEASLKNVLTRSQNYPIDIPAIYKGKTPIGLGLEESGLKLTTVVTKIPLTDIEISAQKEETVIVNQGLSTYKVSPLDIEDLNDPNEVIKLVGKLVYIKDFFVDKQIEDAVSTEWIDGIDYFGVDLVSKESGKDIVVLDPGVSALPPSMYDINSLPKILEGKNSGYTISGGYVFAKEDSQRFWGKRYVTADLIKEEVDSFSYSIFPYTILSAVVEDNHLFLTSIPFTAEMKMYGTINDPTLVFSDKGFIRYVTPTNPRFRKAITTNVDPWQDPVFTSGDTVKPAEVFSCDCASYSKSMIAMPQATQRNDQRKANRQSRYPLPTALSTNRFQNLGIDKVAGRAITWATKADKHTFRYCKHTVTGMFANGVQLIEPSQYPTPLEREVFEDKLASELDSLNIAWKLSAERNGVSLSEIVFSLAQGLNFDDVETGYVVLNSS